MNKIRINKKVLLFFITGALSLTPPHHSKSGYIFKLPSNIFDINNLNCDNDDFFNDYQYGINHNNGNSKIYTVNENQGSSLKLLKYDKKVPAYTLKNVKMRKNHNKNSKKTVKIPRYNKVNLLGRYGKWNLVKYNGKKGYIKSTNLKRLKGDYVEVNITKQNMKYFDKNNQLKINSAVVTGLASNSNTATPVGIYKIYLKEKNRDLVGRNPDGSEKYRSHVSYWMPFKDGYGLHDATWRSDFGGNIYKYSGSHGCVNLPVSTAKKLYSNVKVNTKVLVYKNNIKK